MLIFDIENDDVSILNSFFNNIYKFDLKHWHTKNKNKQSGTSLNDINYSQFVEYLSNIIEKHNKIEPNYREKDYLLNKMCPTYFWNSKKSMKNITYIKYLSLNQCNQFWRMLK